MSVIAWDGYTLAADRRMLSGSLIRSCTKIWRYKKNLIAMVGEPDCGAEMIEWFKKGAKPEEFPEKAREDISNLIVINHKGIFQYGCGPFPMMLEDKKAAWGTGREYAEAAMYLGQDAYQAVMVACQFQSDCGNGIIQLTLEEK